MDEFPDQLKSSRLYKEKKEVLEHLMEQQYFNTAEKFMMMGKASLFGDDDIFNQMSESLDPKKQKDLGQKVKNFDQTVWDRYCFDIVIIGNYLKFSQNETIKKQIKSTGDKTLVEGSPLDKIWGVGLQFDDPLILDKKNWKGKNFLGRSLEIVRDLL
jgi:ribA/ribD-fused uncharacterized protein